MAMARTYRNLPDALVSQPDNNPKWYVLEFLRRILPIVWKVHVRARTGGATYSEFAIPRAVDPGWIVSPAGALEHLQVTPLRCDPHELLVAGRNAIGAGVVGHALEGFIVIVHGDLALQTLGVVVLHHPERERGVGLDVSGGIEIVSEKLLHRGARLGRAIASTETYCDHVMPVRVDDAESLAGEDWV